MTMIVVDSEKNKKTKKELEYILLELNIFFVFFLHSYIL
jgi:hypothetical protein